MSLFDFETAARYYKNDQIDALSKHETGMRYLLLRSLSRREQMERLAADWNLDFSGVRASLMLQIAFESSISNHNIEQTIRAIHTNERTERRKHEAELVSELYKMTVFDWGGLYQNSLDRTIVNNYVKKIRSFDQINEKIDQELLPSMRGYTQCSWYNHWTSILIEDIFKDHQTVLPTVGLIKKVDFFIGEIPYDLKVTYMPEGYIESKRKRFGLRPELTELRRAARDLNLSFDKNLPNSKLIEQLWSMVSDQPTQGAKVLIADMRGFRSQILRESIANPGDLITWLYENQGERRFDATNRLFLILVNNNDYFASWKLKRARELLVANIHEYLDNASASVRREITFNWDNSEYTAYSDALFVVHTT